MNNPLTTNASEAAAGRPGAVILTVGETATTDYFLTPYLESLGYQVTLVNACREPYEAAVSVDSCKLVVISRYLPGCWGTLLDRLRGHGAKLVYFMDDDLFDIRALRGLPLRYQWKIVTQAWRHRKRLMRACSEFWVSTDYLAKKYAQYHPRQLSPMPSHKTLENRQAIHVCYHGTASHQREIEWLLPIIKGVQERSNNIHFELFGTRALQRLTRKLPRVSILHPMSWPNYLAYTAAQRRDIALAPLLGGGFNAARSTTKFYDYTRLGAVGLYSDIAPYRGFVRNGVDGMLLDNDPEHWIAAILALANDAPRRDALAAAARQRVGDAIRAGTPE